MADEDQNSESTQPWQVIPDSGPRMFLRRRQEQRIAEAHDAGRGEEDHANACAAATAFVPEDFLTACRLAETTPRNVTILGMSVTIVPSRRTSNADPDAEIAAWATFRQIVLATTFAATGDVESASPEMPPQITAAYWRTRGGHQVRVIADCPSEGWLRHRGRRLPGGVASLLPMAGVAGAKMACACLTAVAVGVAVVAAPHAPSNSLTPGDQQPVVMREGFVPPLEFAPGIPTMTRTARPSRPAAEPSTGHTYQAAPLPRPATHSPKPAPSATPQRSVVPPVPEVTLPPVPVTVPPIQDLAPSVRVPALDVGVPTPAL